MGTASPDELHQRGVSAVNAGRLDDAKDLLEEALRAAADPALVARVESTLAYIAADRSNLDHALALCDRALRFEDLARATRGALLQQRATLLRRAGRAQEALEAFDQSIDALDDRLELARAYLNRGTVHLDRHATISAAADFETAAAYFVSRERTFRLPRPTITARTRSSSPATWLAP
ncbi:tetratricopeptide repeat protein [Nocardioides sp. NPDC023903]|uniref:tetratricopeptide repeat protein n=1 Tax=Nocardioides sp. NPDC023903 TaxID=3157195 RepID=UPI0033E2ECCE